MVSFFLGHPVHSAFISGRGRDKYISLFGFQEKCTLLSYVPKNNKLVLLLSSMHNDDNIDELTGDEKSPEMIACYNKTKGGVDVVDKLCTSLPAHKIRGDAQW